MLVLAIMAVMAAVAMPNLRARSPAYWLEHVTACIHAELLSAKTQALSQGVEVCVSFTDLGDKLGVTKEADRNKNGTIEGDERTKILIDHAAPLTITLPVAEAVFQPDGTFTSTDNNWHVRLKNSDLDDRFIYVFKGGHVQTVTTAM